MGFVTQWEKPDLAITNSDLMYIVSTLFDAKVCEKEAPGIPAPGVQLTSGVGVTRPYVALRVVQSTRMPGLYPVSPKTYHKTERKYMNRTTRRLSPAM